LPSSEPWFSENKENIENQGYSISDYDIGLLIAEIPPTMFAGGASEIGSACSDNIKASTWVGFQNASNPQNLTVGLHELGHKLGATHTFNSIPNTSSCIGERTSITAFEPGSGTTIMSYAGTCGFDQDIIAQRVLAFHTANLLQVSYYITTGLGSTCGTHTALFDTPPLFTFKGLDNLDIPFRQIWSLLLKQRIRKMIPFFMHGMKLIWFQDLHHCPNTGRWKRSVQYFKDNACWIKKSQYYIRYRDC
jgi:hypothetical protein